MKRIALLALLTSVVLASGCASALAQLRVPALPMESRARPEDFILVTVRNEPAPVASRAGSTLRGYDGASSYGVTSAALALVSAIAHDFDLQEVAGWPISALRVHCVVFRRPKATSGAELIERLMHDPRVQLAQPLQTFETSTTATFNDPYARLQPSLDALGLAEAQRWSRGEGVHVAPIDTGVESKHPDLRGRVIVRRNFVDGDMQAFEHDLHGTQVAGVIAANANNREGIVGVAPAAQLLAMKACWHGPSAPGAFCNTFTLAQALVAALNSDADIVNLSLAGPADPLLTELVVRGLARGKIFVGSVPPSGRRDGFPAGIPGVIAADTSVATVRPESVLYAPGRNVLTLTPAGHYDFASGSSLAAAHVTGALALLLARESGAPAADLARLLARTTTATAGAGGSVESINACGALAVLLEQGTCAELATLSVGDVSNATRRVAFRLR